MKDKVINYNFRIYLIIAFFLLAGAFLIFRLYFVQVVHGSGYRNQAESQNMGISSDYFDRGNIFFSTKDDKKISVATINTGYEIRIDPSVISNHEDLFNNLSRFIELDEDEFTSKMTRLNSRNEVLAKRIDKETALKIKDLNLKGVFLENKKWRYYPGENTASQVIGFLSFKDNDLIAQYGLEKQYDFVLEKRNNKYFNNFFIELFSTINKTLVKDKSATGSVVTTIEPTVQSFVEAELTKTRSDWNSEKTGAIIMNPKTGEIISMALNPDFDINKFNEQKSALIFNNELVSGVYEMGSIVKPLTMAIGLDTGSINANTTYEDKGSMTLNNRTFSNFDLKARGVVPMQEVLNQSLNTGVAFIVSRVGNQKFADYMKKLIGGKTGIDLPGEANPLISNLESNRDIEFATASYGQGIAMSPISITRALAALGNGGVLVEPHLLKRIEYDLGYSKDYVLPEPIRIFKPETSEEISRILVGVVDDALKGGTVALPNHTIAAKTGTAQMTNPETKGYYEDKYMHTFFGYFPAYDPQFIIFLYNIDPKGARYSSETLTDPFMNMTKFLINYYEIPPDR
jgi:cell division protein FtsI/penicillin-binding protein 2